MSMRTTILLSLLPWCICGATVFASDSQVKVLIQALSDPNQRQGASVALTRLGQQSVPDLRAALQKNANPDVRIWTAHTLGQLGPLAKSAGKDLAQMLADSDPVLRATSAASLGLIADASEVGALRSALADENETVRCAAAIALGRIGPAARSASPELIAAFKDKPLRAAARAATVKIGAESTKILAASLDDVELRFDALICLRRVNPDYAKQHRLDRPVLDDLASLKRALHDPSRPLSDHQLAAASLSTLGNQGASVLIEAFRTPTLARTAADAFGAQSAAATLELVKVLSHSEAGVRVAAANALANIGRSAAQAAPALTLLLEDQDRTVRFHAVRALHELGPGAAKSVSVLGKVILDEREQEPTRQWAIKTLVVTLPKTKAEVVKVLTKAGAEKANYGVRQLARQQLKLIDPQAAKEAGFK